MIYFAITSQGELDVYDPSQNHTGISIYPLFDALIANNDVDILYTTLKIYTGLQKPNEWSSAFVAFMQDIKSAIDVFSEYYSIDGDNITMDNGLRSETYNITDFDSLADLASKLTPIFTERAYIICFVKHHLDNPTNGSITVQL